MTEVKWHLSPIVVLYCPRLFCTSTPGGLHSCIQTYVHTCLPAISTQKECENMTLLTNSIPEGQGIASFSTSASNGEKRPLLCLPTCLEP